MTVRHDLLVHLLAKFFRQAGAVVHIEPRVFDVERIRPDLDIIFPLTRILADVTVVHPASPSRNSNIELAAASAAEAKKSRTYSTMANNQGARLLAFAVETFGAFGNEASALIKYLRMDATGFVAQAMAQPYFIQALATALQHGNNLVLNEGALKSRAAYLAR